MEVSASGLEMVQTARRGVEDLCFGFPEVCVWVWSGYIVCHCVDCLSFLGGKNVSW
jgi:hypothetical protein